MHHFASIVYQSSRCRICTKGHDTFLHRYTSTSQVPLGNQLPSLIDNQVTQQSLSASVSQPMSQRVDHNLIATALVEVGSQSGAKLFARILLDSGLQVNFIKEMIIYIVMSRVDSKTRSRWEEQLSYDSFRYGKIGQLRLRNPREAEKLPSRGS